MGGERLEKRVVPSIMALLGSKDKPLGKVEGRIEKRGRVEGGVLKEGAICTGALVGKL